jgi:hypothetical protein
VVTVTTTIGHILNPFETNDPELAAAQSLAFRTMTEAARFAAERNIGVELWTAQFSEDRPLPAPFRCAPRLERSILDIGTFAHPRKLPLLGDLVARLYAVTRAEILVFTNVDIALQPDFYVRAVERLGTLDACSITRRTVPLDVASRLTKNELAEWARRDGLAHPGHDCFVFRRALLDGVDLGAMCIGFPPFGRALVAILSMRARPGRFAVLEEERTTYHVGDTKPWQHDRYLDYWLHNRGEATLAIDRVAAACGAYSPTAREIRDAIARQERL